MRPLILLVLAAPTFLRADPPEWENAAVFRIDKLPPPPAPPATVTPPVPK
ncbi:MAG: hypothetical protein WCH40_13355 [Verrucomicrobiales bacterium]